VQLYLTRVMSRLFRMSRVLYCRRALPCARFTFPWGRVRDIAYQPSAGALFLTVRVLCLCLFRAVRGVAYCKFATMFYGVVLFFSFGLYPLALFLCICPRRSVFFFWRRSPDGLSVVFCSFPLRAHWIVCSKRARRCVGWYATSRTVCLGISGFWLAFSRTLQLVLLFWGSRTRGVAYLFSASLLVLGQNRVAYRPPKRGGLFRPPKHYYARWL
jgi:hypothetical protein